MNITVAHNTASIGFNQFDLEAYDLFLKCKALPESQVDYDYETDTYTLSTPSRFANMLGVSVANEAKEELPLPEFLFDDQVAIVKLALDSKRFAVWADCGLGKTLEELEFARQVTHITGGRVLIITLNDIVQQTIYEAKRFYGDSLPIYEIKSRADMRRWCVEGPGTLAITNYEKMNPDDQGQMVNELRHLSGLVLDESSRLKTGGGKQKWALIKSSKGIPYKLSATATPAPNDFMEFASQASFLERMRDEGEIIWTYFTKSPSGEWSVKKHARPAFFRWMSSWSIYVREPRRYGWRLNLEPPPEPEIFQHRINIMECQIEKAREWNVDEKGQVSFLADDKHGIVARSKLSQIAKGFVYEDKSITHIESLKPGYVADLIISEVKAGLQVLVWTVFDEESVLIDQELRARGFESHEMLSGKLPKLKRYPILERFRKGENSGLISKAQLIGYGLNFQNCASMIFSGWNDSFEQFYQAIRRAYRYGQTKAVRVHIPFIPELEGEVLENVMRKQVQFEESIREQETAYLAAIEELKLLKEVV